MRALKILGCAMALAAFVAPGARADDWNKLTYVTFSAPVELPGITLPAGTYAFKLADSWMNRNIVQVFNKQQSKIYGTFLAISDQRLTPIGKPVVLFRESARGTPTAVRGWFYPGDTFGNEFVYPKNQAMKIARASHQPVVATENGHAAGNNAAAMKSARIGHVDQHGKVTEDNQDNRAAARNNANAAAGSTAGSNTTAAYTAAPRNQQQPAGTSAANEPSANQPQTTPQRHRAKANNATVGTSGQATNQNGPGAANTRHGRKHLPQTAGPLGLLALLSGLSLAGAVALRGLRARRGLV